MARARLTYQQALYLGDMVKSTCASGTRGLARVAHFVRPNGELVCRGMTLWKNFEIWKLWDGFLKARFLSLVGFWIP